MVFTTIWFHKKMLLFSLLKKKKKKYLLFFFLNYLLYFTKLYTFYLVWHDLFHVTKIRFSCKLILRHKNIFW